MMNDIYFQSDTWDLAEYPTDLMRKLYKNCIIDHKLDFSGIKSETFKKQAKSYIADFCERKLPEMKITHSYTSQFWRRWVFGLRFLAETDINYNDIAVDHKKLSQGILDFAIKTNGATVTLTRFGKLYLCNNMITGMYSWYQYQRDADENLWNKLTISGTMMGLDSIRINKAAANQSIHLDFLINQDDLAILHRYIKHLAVEESISMATILNIVAHIKGFILYLYKKGKNLLIADRADVIGFYKANEQVLKRSTLDSRISICYKLYEYLTVYNIVSINPFMLSDKSNDKYNYKFKAVDEQTILRIFSILHLLPRTLADMFIIIYCTGMRVSEVCQLQNDCLIHNEKGYFLIFHSQKMRKDVMNPIPESLYHRISEDIASNAALPYHEHYLFHRAPDKAYFSATFSVQLASEFAKLGLKDQNGQPFKFRPHDFRHTLATSMYLSDIDIGVIQSILHHKSIEMTMAYVENNSEHMQKMHTKYLNYRGKALDSIAENDRIEWIRNNLEAQLLPNGICGLPISMGKCPHENACLDGCEYFMTCKEHLSIHIAYLKRLDAYIESEKNENLLTSAKRVRDNVANIIKRLENE